MRPSDRPESVRSGRRWGLALGLLGPFVAAATLVPFRDRLAGVDPALVLVQVVLAAGAVGGRLAGLLGAASATVAFDVFLTRPYGSLRIDEARDIATTALLAAVGLAGALLVERVRQHASRAALLAASLQRLERFVELIGGSETAHRQIDLACQELTALLDLKACRYEPGPCAPDDVRLGHGPCGYPAARPAPAVWCSRCGIGASTSATSCSCPCARRAASTPWAPGDRSTPTFPAAHRPSDTSERRRFRAPAVADGSRRRRPWCRGPRPRTLAGARAARRGG